jgi:hypothetical protein
MHRRRGGEARKRGIVHRVVTPASDQYPSLAAGFRRRALFFREVVWRQIRALTIFSGHFCSPLGSLEDPGPYVSGTVVDSD